MLVCLFLAIGLILYETDETKDCTDIHGHGKCLDILNVMLMIGMSFLQVLVQIVWLSYCSFYCCYYLCCFVSIWSLLMFLLLLI